MRLQGSTRGHLGRAAAVTGITVAAALAVLPITRPSGDTTADAQTAAAPYHWPHYQVPVGVTLSGLQDYIVSRRTITMMKHQIYAAKHFWYANTVRLQIEQDRLVGADGTVFNRQYMAAIRETCSYVLHQDMTCVLNAQTEQTTGYGANEHLPTHATTVFWARMLTLYANNPRVVFDLFNEPRLTHWSAWHLAMQHLVNVVRRKARNVIWVEGLWWGSTLAGVRPLHGTGIVYTWHKPGNPWPWKGKTTIHWWNQAFGDFCDQDHACVDGEFGNYKGSFYWRHTAEVRKYLRYLAQHHIGMLAWTLTAGSLNKDQSYMSVSHEPEGDGAIVRRWFATMTGHKIPS